MGKYEKLENDFKTEHDAMVGADFSSITSFGEEAEACFSALQANFDGIKDEFSQDHGDNAVWKDNCSVKLTEVFTSISDKLTEFSAKILSATSKAKSALDSFKNVLEEYQNDIDTYNAQVDMYDSLAKKTDTAKEDLDAKKASLNTTASNKPPEDSQYYNSWLNEKRNKETKVSQAQTVYNSYVKELAKVEEPIPGMKRTVHERKSLVQSAKDAANAALGAL